MITFNDTGYSSYNFISEYVSRSDLARIVRASKIAQTSTHRFRIGAAIYKSGRFLSFGVNVLRGGPTVPPNRFSIHAEQMALSRCPDPKGATMYIVRVDAFDDLALAKPCQYCLASLFQEGIDKVVFSTNGSLDSFRLNMVTFSKGVPANEHQTSYS